MALDASIGIGAEPDYGTAAATLDGYEGKADSWKTTREFIESVGFRAGMQTARADRRNLVNMGGEGELEVDLLDVGGSSLLTAAFDRHTVTEDPDTGFTTHVFETAAHPEGPSFTAEMIRPTVEGTNVAYRHVGCAATEWSLSAEVENAVTLNVSFNFRDVSHTSNGPDFLPLAYPDDGRVYDWTRTAVTLTRAGNSVPVEANSFELTADRGLKTDRRFLRGSPLKSKPVRAALPTYEGSLEGEFTNDAVGLYEAFLAAEVLALSVHLDGLTPGTSVTVECPAIQFTGESPEASVDDVTTANLPYRVLDPGDGSPAIRLTYVEPTPGWVPPAG